MSYDFESNRIYRMPTHFGPALGPRQNVKGEGYDCRDNPKATMVSMSFLTNREQLDALLPPLFKVGEDPIVTVVFTYLTEVEWLAGRGYNTLGVTFPAIYRGERDEASGEFLAVLWENMADPIITGREELGFSKIYCDIPAPRLARNACHCTANWEGFKFIDLEVIDLHETEGGVPGSIAPSKAAEGEKKLTGYLHYKYIPKTQTWGTPDVSYPVLTPLSSPNMKVLAAWNGSGSIRFHRPSWEDMPTQFTIVNALADLEIKEYKAAKVIKTRGAKDISDQIILR